MHETPEQKGRRIGVPVIPALPGVPKAPRDPNPTFAVCGKCGLELKRLMGYVCSNADCPTGLGGTRVTL